MYCEHFESELYTSDVFRSCVCGFTMNGLKF